MMISGFNDVIWGQPGADEQIAQVIASIRAAGRAGLPVMEYNFYAHRLVEGSFGPKVSDRVMFGNAATSTAASRPPTPPGRRGRPC